MAERPGQSAEYKFKNVQLFKNETLGTGSYGAVCKAKCDQLICAAKLLYPVLFQMQAPDPGKEHRQPFRRFELECSFLSLINHPNIVQYLGTYRDPDTNVPVLLMEFMDESLTHFLESSPGDIFYHIQVNLSYDIAQALAFLHANGIIHRDLSSNNVLLIGDCRAKVTDFGMSKFIDLNQTRQATMTQCPGTPIFMSPEALNEPPVYTEKLDNFSLGVIIIQIITKKYPDPTDRFVTRELVDPNFPSQMITAKVPVKESERRVTHISLIDTTHPLLQIALDCLKDQEADRPTSQQLCQSLGDLKETQAYQESSQQDKDHIIRSKDEEIRAKDEQIQTKEQDLAIKIHQLQERVEELDVQKDQIKAKEAEISTLKQHLNMATTENDSMSRKIRDCEEENAQLQQVTLLQQTQSTAEVAEERPVCVRVQESIENPFEIDFSSSYAIVKTKVYFHERYSSNSKIVEYDLINKTWSKVAVRHPLSGGFTIVSVDNILTTVGGNGLIRYSNRLYCFLYKKWVEVFPPMNNRLETPHAMYTKPNVIVVQRYACVIEILNIKTLQWSVVQALPRKYWDSIFIHGSYIFAQYCGYSNEQTIFYCSLSALIENPKESENLWKEIQPPPSMSRCIVSIRDQHLLAIGGQKEKEKQSVEDDSEYMAFPLFPWQSYEDLNDILEYCPAENSWKVVGQMSKPRRYCSAVCLPDNTLMILDSDSIDILQTTK